MPRFSSGERSRKMSGICPPSSRTDAWYGKLLRRNPVKILYRKVERRVGFPKARPKRKRFIVPLLQIVDCLVCRECAQHVFVMPGKWKIFRIQPDPGGVAKRLPLGRLGCGVRRDGLWLHPALPLPVNYFFRHHHVEAEQPWPSRTIKVHLPEHGGFVARFSELFGERWLIRRKFPAQHRHSGRMRQLARKERSVVTACTPANCSNERQNAIPPGQGHLCAV